MLCYNMEMIVYRIHKFSKLNYNSDDPSDMIHKIL